MMGFIVFAVAALSVSIVVMIQMKKSFRELPVAALIPGFFLTNFKDHPF
ncbi:MAG: hypothetical protein K0Q94_771 [Paenibacillus sp.]|jgi:hypothetical protein|nr:hypothetical protein [Paenibacillus sp.]